MNSLKFLLLLAVIPLHLHANPVGRGGIEAFEVTARRAGLLVARESSEKAAAEAAEQVVLASVGRVLADDLAVSSAQAVARGGGQAHTLTIHYLDEAAKPAGKAAFPPPAIGDLGRSTLHPVADAMIARSWWKEVIALPIGIGAGMGLYDFSEKLSPYTPWLLALGFCVLILLFHEPTRSSVWRWVCQLLTVRVRKFRGDISGSVGTDGDSELQKGRSVR